MLTLPTGNGNTSTSFRYTNLLLTIRTFVYMMCLSLLQFTFMFSQTRFYLPLVLQILLVFSGAFINLFGKHAIISIYHHQQRQQVAQISAKHENTIKTTAKIIKKRFNWSTPYLPCIKRTNFSFIPLISCLFYP